MNTPTRTNPIQITERDKRRLEKLIERTTDSDRKEANFDSLIAELAEATVVKSEAIPRNVVTMRSLVSIIDQDTSERLQYRLVYPDQIDPNASQVSIQSTLGTSLLGRQTGDEIEWSGPSGTRRFVIAKVDYQPEASNTYHL
ncbi:MAG: GreA/GreB family elongation factor [Verrucomicrobiaceae bacterium]